MPGLFSIFNTSKSGLFSQQTSLNVTSHNIANANTDGYSRQRADLVTTSPYTMPSMNNAASAGQLGTGVTVASIDRIRDTFLDYQYRIENGINGLYTGRDKYLSQVEGILNEPTDTGISDLMGKFFDSWQDLNTSPSDNTTVVAQQALQLTDNLNHTYSQLTDLVKDAQEGISSDVLEINQMLGQITQLNQQIRDVSISGNNPNDLMDKRDLLLDQLSEKFGISVDQKSYDGIDVTTTNTSILGSAGDNNGLAPIGADGKPVNIVQSIKPDDANVATFSYINAVTPDTVDENGTGSYKVVYYKKGIQSDANKVELTINDMTAEQANDLLKYRVLWSDNNGNAYSVDGDNKIQGTSPTSFSQLALFKPPTGELNGYMSVQDDIESYQVRLDKLAKSLAVSVNAIISQNGKFTADGSGSPEGGINNFFVNGDYKDKSGADYTAEYEDGINASNITVNVKIMEDPSKIKTDTKYDSQGNAVATGTDGQRALAVAQLRDTLLDVQGMDENGEITSREDFIDKTGIFKADDTLDGVYTLTSTTGGSTLDGYFRGTINTVGTQEQTAKNEISTGASRLASYDESRASVSGVSIDEEMTNLIQFQHCYQANAKMISTVDELLDVVINGLKK
ncbi:MAG: flagellar hook-associated protein FlgK [Clostridium sp.]|jgi:flagellar hook-associated protein 1 FlgK|uniref:flagellar hook-associated protein FlgK n=1 Tax=Clostridium sp. TaxID=1506 RepID=UPI0025BD20AD|nr:flagellar hook-associated protein FlgK [Clostridium sp.]MCH3964333.1 flagellar hook-associated protein FlgK [Clostridium sp.]MCI1715508.1 flagellar hook-associated protein FlgK [Clostridium sp.]MCI1799700.1 flagellar hook-associated protein FlgK [Clostridium sp.]MCI1813692.1 flagellar hook-associated protein FlgK [Clostridium sp.]MCI1870513.1 flagellar hook-associated protein FlgK [Clostridium sp.]